MTDLDFLRLCEELQTGEVELRDRYDAVFHLVTAAKGAIDAYTTANNAARRESPEQAAALLRKMLRMGVLDGAYLEEDDGELQFTKSVWAKQLVECVHCGAKQTVNLGQTLVCAYCGSALQVKRAYTESV